MSGNNCVVDTNCIIYLFTGNEKVARVINDSRIYISAITFTELLSFSKLSTDEAAFLRQIIEDISVIHTSNAICEIAAGIRRKTKLKPPDALIAATSLFMNLPLLTFDSGFKKVENLKIIRTQE